MDPGDPSSHLAAGKTLPSSGPQLSQQEKEVAGLDQGSGPTWGQGQCRWGGAQHLLFNCTYTLGFP